MGQKNGNGNCSLKNLLRAKLREVHGDAASLSNGESD